MRKNPFIRAVWTACLLAAFLAPGVRANPLANLDGATGNIFRFDPEKRSFELLKETEYAPKSDIGQSRFTVYWTDSTTILKIGEGTSFAGIPSPVVVTFQGIDGANRQALKARRPFEARVATVFPGSEITGGPATDSNQVTARFTPDAGDAPRGGTIVLDGKPVRVSLRKHNSRVFVHEPATPEDLSTGFWQATIRGAETDGRFVIKSMEVAELADPRATDDPKLPRVLVIGDSISMNYHEAARSALRGVANYHRIEGNGATSAHGVRNAELWLGNYREKGLHWDVIQFNHGLHDLKQAYNATTDAFGEYSVPIEDYKANLEQEIAILRKTGARLIWCSTTPVPNSNKGTYARRKGAAAVFNRAAMEVMRKHPDIIVNDLYQLIGTSPVFDQWRKGIDVHFYQEKEREALGGAVAAAARKALARPFKRLPLPAGTFTVEGRPAFLMLPENSVGKKSQPWVWYAPALPNTPGPEEAWMFRRFLENGIAIAGIDVGESMGNPAGRALFSAFYTELVGKRGMSAKPCLLARSRGGLMLYNWAAENPRSVAAIAGIYPVGDLASWPGLAKAGAAYGLTGAQLAARLADHNPIDRLAPLARAGIPILHIHGDRDKTVPLERNSGLIKTRYDELGGSMNLVIIENGGHDMSVHWFQNTLLTDFAIRQAKEATPSR